MSFLKLSVEDFVAQFPFLLLIKMTFVTSELFRDDLYWYSWLSLKSTQFQHTCTKCSTMFPLSWRRSLKKLIVKTPNPSTYLYNFYFHPAHYNPQQDNAENSGSKILYWKFRKSESLTWSQSLFLQCSPRWQGSVWYTRNCLWRCIHFLWFYMNCNQNSTVSHFGPVLHWESGRHEDSFYLKWGKMS